ncbi:alpha/beta fold hydrolase [Flavihumibacter sp. R14]|nr:alpha/beta fold hydrolase [Flavihumibacter soli]
MPKPYLAVIILLSCSSLVISSCKNQTSLKLEKKIDKSFISEDEMPDSLSPAGIIELKIPSSGSNIYGFSYTANGKRLHPTVVMLHGMPGNERNLDLAQNLRRGGYNVVYFNYRGSWGSEGKYSYSNSLQDVSAVVDFITDSSNVERLKIDTSRIALVGHSMGAGIAMINGIKNHKIKAIAGISVFNPYTLLQGKEAQSNVLGLEEYISTLGMLKTDPESYLNDLLAHIKDYNIESMIASTKKPVLVIDEHTKNDYLGSIKKKKLIYKVWDTDHAFTNRRILLSIEIKSWLDKNLK